MRDNVGIGLVNLARVALIAAIVIASAAYGLTRESTIVFFSQWLSGTFCLWVVGYLIATRWPAVPWLAWVLVVGLLAVGGASVILAWLDLHLFEMAPNYPIWLDDWLLLGAFDLDQAIAATWRTAALLAGFLIAIDLFSAPNWSRALLMTLAFTALGMVGFFFLQRAFGDPFLLRSDVDPRVTLNFATFRYWGNGASYLNLVWPLLAALAAHTAFAHQAKGWMLWLGGALCVFSALFINVSKAGNVLAPVGLLLFGLILGINRWRHRGSRGLRFSPAAVIGSLVPIVVIAVSLAFAIPEKRWEHLQERQLDSDPRVVAYGYFVQMVPDAGWLGFGPGSFKLAYWEYVGDDPVMRRTPFWVAHQDYLQTVIEWGYLGTTLWGLLLAVPTVALFRNALRRIRDRSDPDEGYVFGWGDYARQWWRALPDARSPLVAGAATVAIILTGLHALVDFPMQIMSLQFYFLLWIALGWSLCRPKLAA